MEETSEKCIVVEGEKEFKITEHYLVPKHEIMTEKETAEVLKKFNITKKQFPTILHSDPVVKDIGAKVGQVIKITRNSQVAGKSIYYRIVSK